ncbi:hypothetical protein EDD17DRAFT_1508736 [Pisolithus thermaeus]|nr:hypothetical protein EV401DRAFT_1890653 [Pisolithus croceorrhizus]KAI6161886.1 hypothetical protein EDD17DRAFT_1508736 [Pisolithus thermaeus]
MPIAPEAGFDITCTNLDGTSWAVCRMYIITRSTVSTSALTSMRGGACRSGGAHHQVRGGRVVQREGSKRRPETHVTTGLKMQGRQLQVCGKWRGRSPDINSVKELSVINACFLAGIELTDTVKTTERGWGVKYHLCSKLKGLYSDSAYLWQWARGPPHCAKIYLDHLVSGQSATKSLEQRVARDGCDR